MYVEVFDHSHGGPPKYAGRIGIVDRKLVADAGCQSALKLKICEEGGIIIDPVKFPHLWLRGFYEMRRMYSFAVMHRKDRFDNPMSDERRVKRYLNRKAAPGSEEETLKFNPNHDQPGLFSSGGVESSSGESNHGTGELGARSYDDLKKLEDEDR